MVRYNHATWNKQEFVLLPNEHKFSKLIACHIHNSGGHLGLNATMSQICARFWIIRLRTIVKQIRKDCLICKLKYKQPIKQAMSSLPIERLNPSPPFYAVCLDMFGPFTLRGEVQKRIHGKCFGVIINCLSSRAVYCDVAYDYSSDAFLQLMRRFASFRGWPRLIFSDRGSQLVGASKDLQRIIEGMDWEKLQQYGYAYKTEWQFSPADAPWYNGTSESLIKTVKASLTCAIGEQILTFS